MRCISPPHNPQTDAINRTPTEKVLRYLNGQLVFEVTEKVSEAVFIVANQGRVGVICGTPR